MLIILSNVNISFTQPPAWSLPSDAHCSSLVAHYEVTVTYCFVTCSTIVQVQTFSRVTAAILVSGAHQSDNISVVVAAVNEYGQASDASTPVDVKMDKSAGRSSFDAKLSTGKSRTMNVTRKDVGSSYPEFSSTKRLDGQPQELEHSKIVNTNESRNASEQIRKSVDNNLTSVESSDVRVWSREDVPPKEKVKSRHAKNTAERTAVVEPTAVVNFSYLQLYSRNTTSLTFVRVNSSVKTDRNWSAGHEVRTYTFCTNCVYVLTLICRH